MRKRTVVALLLAFSVLMVLVQFVWAMPSGSPLAQATTTATAQITGTRTAQATGTTTASGEETPLPPPERGCYACHVQVEEDGRFTLAWEAMERMKAQGKEHPELPLTTKYEDCLICHGGKTAKTMSSIVHPAHMFSLTFAEEFRGNCFSCHEVMDQEFTVLVDKQNVNDKGVIQATTTVTGTVTTGTRPAGTPAATGTATATRAP